MGMLSEEALEARRKYQREWRRKNPEKYKASIYRYWQRKAEKALSENTLKKGNENGES